MLRPMGSSLHGDIEYLINHRLFSIIGEFGIHLVPLLYSESLIDIRLSAQTYWASTAGTTMMGR